MARGYWILQADITDIHVYGAYRKAIDGFLPQFGGKFVVRAGRKKDVEGAPRSRQVVIEFHDYEKAVEAYKSPEYQKINALRVASSVADMAIVEGV